MNSITLEKEIAGLKEARKKTINWISGDKCAIAYRGVVSLVSAGVLATSTTTLVRTAPTIASTFINEGMINGGFAVLGSAVASVLIPLSASVIIHEVSCMKENIKMLDLNKKNLKIYDKEIEAKTKVKSL